MKIVSFTKRSYLNEHAAAMKRGDEQAAQLVYRELAQKAYAFFLNRTGNSAQAQDLTQETFLMVVRALDSFDEKKGDFTVWFWQIARNKLIDFFRSQGKITHVSLENELLAMSSGMDIEEDTDIQLLRGKIIAQLAGYEPHEQEMFQLRFFAGLPYYDIAQIVGKSEGATRVKINRMQKEIKKQLRSL